MTGLTRSETAFLVWCVAIIVVGGMIWMWAIGSSDHHEVTPDSWPTVVRSGVVVQPEDLDRFGHA